MIVKHVISADAGELSPWLDARTDMAKYASGFRTLRNFITTPQGGVIKRPGTQYLSQLPSGLSVGTLIEFQVSSSTASMLVLSGGLIRVWNQSGVQITVSGSPLTIAMPWADADLPKLRHVQINDVMYFAHGGYPLYRLLRYSDTSWTLEAVDHGTNVPFLPENTSRAKYFSFGAGSSAAWSGASKSYAIGDLVTTVVSSVTITWVCQWAHISAATGKNPGNAAFTFDDYDSYTKTTTTKLVWSQYLPADLTVPNQVITISVEGANVFNAGHVGTMWQISTNLPSTAYEVSFRAISGNNGLSSDPLYIAGDWTFETFSTWYGTFSIQISRNAGLSWTILREYTSATDTPRNASSSGTENGVLMRILWVHTSNGTANPYARLSASDSRLAGYVRINSVVTNTTPIVVAGNPNPIYQTITATCLTRLRYGRTYYWAEGAWSSYQGYPSVIEVHDGRLMVAATPSSPHTVWGSASDDYPNFSMGTDADEAFAHTIPAGSRDPILWMVSSRALLLGTGAAEFSMTGETEDRAITPEFAVARRQTSLGASAGAVSCLISENASFFIQRGGQRVREFAYQLESDNYQAQNLCILADHVFDGYPVTSAAVQRMPFHLVWFVAGGNLWGLTYEKGQNIAAWHRHTTTGTVLSVATIRTESLEDQVWLLVLRNGRINVERFRPNGFIAPGADGWWMDAAISMSTASGADHLVGQTVLGVRASDGQPFGPAVWNGSGWPFVVAVTVSGAGEADGTYQAAGWLNGRPLFSVGENRMEFDGEKWMLFMADALAFRSGPSSNPAPSGWVDADGNASALTITWTYGPTSGACVVGLSYQAEYFPMRPELPMQNGSSRSREIRIHAIVPSVYKAFSGSYGQIPNGDTMPLHVDGALGLYTGEIEKQFSGDFSTDGNFCIISNDPGPFSIRSVAIKMNVFGDV